MPNPQNKIIFTEAQQQFLKNNYLKMTNKQLAAALDLKQTVVRNQLYKMGCKKYEVQYWTNEQIAFVKKNYKKIGDTEIAEIFNKKYNKIGGWSKKHIEKKRRYLKLKRVAADRDQIRKRNKKRGCWQNAWSYSSANQVPIGEKRIVFNGNTPYLKIKTKNGFESFARYLWKQKKGKIPKGKKVRIMQEDRINFTIDNLKLVSSAENALLNSINRTPAELKSLAALQKQLKNTIIKKSRDENRN